MGKRQARDLVDRDQLDDDSDDNNVGNFKGNQADLDDADTIAKRK